MWDDYDFDIPQQDEDSWEKLINERERPVGALIDLLFMLRVLQHGPAMNYQYFGFDVRSFTSW